MNVFQILIVADIELISDIANICIEIIIASTFNTSYVEI
jgi:hypothetical protein